MGIFFSDSKIKGRLFYSSVLPGLQISVRNNTQWRSCFVAHGVNIPCSIYQKIHASFHWVIVHVLIYVNVMQNSFYFLQFVIFGLHTVRSRVCFTGCSLFQWWGKLKQWKVGVCWACAMFAVLESELVVLDLTQSLSIIAKNLSSGLVFSATSERPTV